MDLGASIRKLALGAFAISSILMGGAASAHAQDSAKKPNIVVIMGDDIGMWNIGAYHRGLMAGRTPNLDKMAAEGMIFTDYYAEASCTAGRANFITGELPIRTGMTTVGQAGAPIGIPAQAVTIATTLKSMGYATGQFGKNHLGDRNEYLPTVHGFDEFYGYLYHLDAMEDPCHPNYPPALKETVGPRHMVHSWATNVDDPTVQPRWGKIGKQKIQDDGELCPKRMETIDDEILANATTPSSFSPPITEPKTSPGRTADKLHSPAARVQHSKAVSDARRLFAGQARCLLERLRTEYSLASTGSRRS